MIDVKIIAKPKGGAAASGGAASGGGSVTLAVPDEARHAQTADRATHAEKADYADTAGAADTARWAAEAETARDVAEDSPAYARWLRKDVADTAAGVVTFLGGLLLGEGGRWYLDKLGEAVLKSLSAEGVEAGALSAAKAAINKVTSGVSFEETATFLKGLVADVTRSSDYTAALRGWLLGNVASTGRSRLEVDELLVRVKAVFNELEIRKLSYTGGNIEISAAGSTIYRVAQLGSRAANLIPGSDLPEIDPDVMKGSDQYALSAMSLAARTDALGVPYNELVVSVSGRGALLYYGLYWDIAVTPGQAYTLSFFYRTDEYVGGEGAALEIEAAYSAGNPDTYRFPGTPGLTDGKMELPEAAEDTMVSVTVEQPASMPLLRVRLWQRKNGVTAFSRPCLRAGESAPWSVADRWRCWLTKDDGTTRTRNWWRPGDQAKCQTFNIDGDVTRPAALLSAGGAGITDGGRPVGHAGAGGSGGNRYYWRLVTDVGTDTDPFGDGRDYDWVELSDADTVLLENASGETVSCSGRDTVFDGYDNDSFKWHEALNDAPQAGDEIVQEGSQTDPDRQHIIRLSTVGENAPAIEEYVGVGRRDGDPGPWSLSGRLMTRIAPRVGNYFRARSFEMETDGGAVVRVPCDRGEWSGSETYGYYDRVSHGGSLWLCVSKSGAAKGVEPSAGSSVWQQQVSAGAPGKDGLPGSVSAVRAELSPAALVITEKDDGTFDLSKAMFTLRVTRGVGEDITAACTITSVGAEGCTAEAGAGGVVKYVRLTGIVGRPENGSVQASVSVPSDYTGTGKIETLTVRGAFAVSWLGTFRSTVENDVKRDIAERSFTYTDADGQLQTVTGISELVQSAEGLTQTVLRQHPSGSVLANGSVAAGLEKWAGDPVLGDDGGTPYATVSDLEQQASAMTCDWAGAMASGGSVPARVSFRARAQAGTRIFVELQLADGGSASTAGFAWFTVVQDGVWTRYEGDITVTRAPYRLRLRVLTQGKTVDVTDLRLVPDFPAMLGSQIKQTADSITQTVADVQAGLRSQIEQTADGITQEVWRRKPSGSVLANGSFADGLDKWSVKSGVVTATALDGVPCMKFGGIGTVEQSAADMEMDWEAVMPADTALDVKVELRALSYAADTVMVALLDSSGSTLRLDSFSVDGSRQWARFVSAYSVSKRPAAIKVYQAGAADIFITGIQLVPDIDALLGSRIAQTADSISLKVTNLTDGLLDTGIDIGRGEVIVTADNFRVRNNQGELTAAVDAEGRLTAGSLEVTGDGGSQASVRLGIDENGEPYLVGVNGQGATVWLFNGKMAEEYTDNVAMVFTSGGAHLSKSAPGGLVRYDMAYTVTANVTNKSNAQVSFQADNDGPLRCKIRAYDAGPMIYLGHSGVVIPAQGTKEVTFTGTHALLQQGDTVPTLPWRDGDRLPVELCYFGNGGREIPKGIGMADCTSDVLTET